jgi:rsbT co-antagonist protein RsbR
MVERLRVTAARNPHLAPLLEQPDPERDRVSRALIRGALAAGEWDAYWEDVRTQAAGYAMADIPFSAWSDLISMLREEATAIVERAHADDDARRVGAQLALGRWLDAALGVFGDVFTSTMAAVINRQQAAIRELSTPVLQVRPQLLIVPVVGVLDAARLNQLEAEVLTSVRARRARVVVLDVTGVPSLEAEMAEQLVRTVVGVRLMGAEVVVSGLSAALAQTLVTGGVDLGALRSVGDLQSGIEAAERLLA